MNRGGFFLSYGPSVLEFALVLAVVGGRLGPEFGGGRLAGYEEIDHCLIQISSKPYEILRI